MERNTPSRRKLLQGGLAATGAAYVAPQVLRTSAVGAVAGTRHAFEVFSDLSCSAINLSSTGHSLCTGPFNNEFIANSAGADISCPPVDLCLGQFNFMFNEFNVGFSTTSTTASVLWYGVRGVRFRQTVCEPLSSPTVTLEPGGRNGVAGIDNAESISSLILVVECMGSIGPPGP